MVIWSKSNISIHTQEETAKSNNIFVVDREGRQKKISLVIIRRHIFFEKKIIRRHINTWCSFYTLEEDRNNSLQKNLTWCSS